jgi:hypothetical protein
MARTVLGSARGAEPTETSDRIAAVVSSLSGIVAALLAWFGEAWLVSPSLNVGASWRLTAGRAATVETGRGRGGFTRGERWPHFGKILGSAAGKCRRSQDQLRTQEDTDEIFTG